MITDKKLIKQFRALISFISTPDATGSHLAENWIILRLNCASYHLERIFYGSQENLSITRALRPNTLSTAKPDGLRIRWSWEIKSDLNAYGRYYWLQTAEIAISCGLEAGYCWKNFPDAPYVPNRYLLNMPKIKEIYRTWHGINAAWSELKDA